MWWRQSQLGAKKFASGAGRGGDFSEFSSSSKSSTTSPATLAASSTTPGSEERKFDAVVFDLGGVLIDSPLVFITEYEAELGLPQHTLNK